MELNTSDINVCFSAYEQVFMFKGEDPTYSIVYENFREKIQAITISNNINEEIQNFDDLINKYDGFSSEFGLNYDDYCFIGDKFVNSLINSGNKLIIYENENEMLLYSYYVLKMKGYLDYFEFVTINQLKNRINENPKTYIVIHTLETRLYEFKELKCWKLLSKPLIKASFYKFQQSNYYLEEEKGIYFALENNFNADLIILDIFSSVHLFSIIKKINQQIENFHANAEKLNNYFAENNTLNVLVICTNPYKKKFFVKSSIYHSNSDVLYVPFINHMDLSKFQAVICKLILKDDFDYFSNILSELKDRGAIFLNNYLNLIKLNQRNLMIDFMEEFSLNESLQELNKDKDYTLKVPHSVFLPIHELLGNHEEHLNKSNMKLPLILKMDGANEVLKHTLVLIYNENGIKNLEKSLEKENLKG